MNPENGPQCLLSPPPFSAWGPGHDFSKTRQTLPCPSLLGGSLVGGCRGRRQRPWISARAGGRARSEGPSCHAPGIVQFSPRRVPGRRGARSERVCGVCGLSDEELCVPGRCESGCSGCGDCGCLRGVSPEPGAPSPTLHFAPSPPKFGARARTGKVGGAGLGGLPGAPEAVPRLQFPTYPSRRASSGGGGSDSPRLGSGARSIRS